MNTYTVSVYKSPVPLTQVAKDLWRYQCRTGFPVQKALAFYRRPSTWQFTNKREAKRFLRNIQTDGTGRTATLTTLPR